MKNLLDYLRGNKTYIVGLLFVIYGALVYFKVPGVPGPQELGAAFAGIGLLAATARSAFSTEINKLIVGSTVPVIDTKQVSAIEEEIKAMESTIASLLALVPKMPEKAAPAVVVTPLASPIPPGATQVNQCYDLADGNAPVSPIA